MIIRSDNLIEIHSKQLLTQFLRFLAIASLAALTGCAALAPHKIEIQQGNYISPEMASQLKLGMTKQQVRFLLGTPLLVDVFHAERWDYMFYRDDRKGSVEERKLSVYFQDGKLSRFAGDVTPAASQAVEKVN
jgi:outer membrane protein assembly factor BamE